MLIQWGCDKADRDGIDVFLDATPVGRPLYERFGFETVKDNEVDLKPFGVDHIHHTYSMIRKPLKHN